VCARERARAGGRACACACIAWLGAFGISMGKKKQVCNKCESCREGENNMVCASVYKVVGD